MENKKHILVVDDDLEIRELLGDFLAQHKYSIKKASNGVEMMKVLEKETIDLIILDVMMPGQDGFALCQKVRTTSTIPIIMLTAVGEETDRIIGLELGADDYITKPFNPRELLARVKAVFRRTDPIEKSVTARSAKLCFLSYTLELGTRRLLDKEDVEVSLTTGEFDLLLALLERPKRVLSRDQLLDITRNRTAGPFDRSIDVQISRLRQKLEEDPKNPTLIKTVRGGGYMLTSNIEKE